MLQDTLIDMRTHESLAPIIRNMAHPLRLRILDCLYAVESPQTVSAIAAAASVPQPIVSHHLNILRGQGVVAARRAGRLTLYGIVDRTMVGPVLECARQNEAAHAIYINANIGGA